MSAQQFAVIQEALANAPRSCRYHGTDFTFLGTEPWSRDGLPRCDSCKQPWRATRALDALDRIVRAHDARPTPSTEYGWAPDGDASDVRVSLNPDPAAREMWVRRCVAEQGGSVFVRDVTEWRQEP